LDLVRNTNEWGSLPRVKLARFSRIYEAAQRETIFNAKFTPPNFAQLAIIAGRIGSAVSARGIHHALFLRLFFHWMAYPHFRYRTMNTPRIRVSLCTLYPP